MCGHYHTRRPIIAPPQWRIPQWHIPQRRIPQWHIPQWHIPQWHIPQWHLYDPITFGILWGKGHLWVCHALWPLHP